MWASDYPGMSSMGKLMALALLCTMLAAVLFQPVLMGPPRKAEPHPGEAAGDEPGNEGGNQAQASTLRP